MDTVFNFCLFKVSFGEIINDKPMSDKKQSTEDCSSKLIQQLQLSKLVQTKSKV